MEYIYYTSVTLAFLLVTLFVLLLCAVIVGITTRLVVESLRNCKEILFAVRCYWVYKQDWKKADAINKKIKEMGTD